MNFLRWMKAPKIDKRHRLPRRVDKSALAKIVEAAASGRYEKKEPESLTIEEALAMVQACPSKTPLERKAKRGQFFLTEAKRRPIQQKLVGTVAHAAALRAGIKVLGKGGPYLCPKGRVGLVLGGC